MNRSIVAGGVTTTNSLNDSNLLGCSLLSYLENVFTEKLVIVDTKSLPTRHPRNNIILENIAAIDQFGIFIRTFKTSK